MEQFLIEHPFAGLIPYAIITGFCLALAIGCVIIFIREVRYLHEEKEDLKHQNAIKAWHQLGDDYLEVMDELRGE